jgi:hypothetical protein
MYFIFETANPERAKQHAPFAGEVQMTNCANPAKGRGGKDI